MRWPLQPKHWKKKLKVGQLTFTFVIRQQLNVWLEPLDYGHYEQNWTGHVPRQERTTVEKFEGNPFKISLSFLEQEEEADRKKNASLLTD